MAQRINIFLPNIVNVAIYVRVSTEEQAEHGYSIEAQLTTLRGVCKSEHKVVFNEYVDAGISGKSIEKRPQLQQLLKDVESGKIQEVIVWKLDRISRKLSDMMLIAEHFKRNNVKFRSHTEQEFDTNSASGNAMMQIMGVMAELQRNMIVENVKMGMKQRARNGKWNGGTVLGYDVVEVMTPKGKESVLRINHIEAELVRKIFRMYASGLGLRSTANQLNGEGFKTKPGNAFSSISVKTIINNPVYVGKIRYNVRENWSEQRRKGINKDPIIVDGEHEAIISEELWEGTQNLYKQKAVSAPRKFDGIYLLTGLMRCPQCGATLVAHRVTDTLKDGSKIVRRYYVCSNFRAKGRRVCSSNSVKADFAENFVVERIAEVVQDPKVLKDIVLNINKSRSKNIVPLQKELAAIDKELKTLDTQKQRYFNLYEHEAIDNYMLLQRLNELKAKYDVLARRKSEAELQLQTNQSEPVPLQLVRRVLTNFSQLLQNSPLESQKTLIQTMVKKISVQKGQKLKSIELEFNDKLQNCFLGKASSTNKVGGAFAFPGQKHSVPFSIVI